MNEYFLLGERKFVPQVRQFYRVKHDIEMGAPWRPGLPEVHPMINNNYTPLTRSWQLVSKNMNSYLHPLKWRQVYTHQRFITNFNGFERPGDPRADFVNMLDTDMPLPKQENLVCGGAILCGIEQGDWLEVETLNGRDGPPPLEVIMSAPWLYFHAVTVAANGTPRLFPQGDGRPILIPLLSFNKAYFPMGKLHKWPLGQALPNPYSIYLPTQG